MASRLQDLRARANLGNSGPAQPVVAESDPFAPFWTRYNDIQEKMERVEENLQEVQQLDQDMSSSTDQNEAGQMREDIQRRLRSITQDADVIRRDLESLREEIDGQNADDVDSAEIRLQRNHLQVLSNDFARVVNHVTETNAQIKQRFSREVVRHFRINGMDIDEQEAQNIIAENPGVLQENVFTITGGQKTAEAAQLYNQIAGRTRDIEEINRGLTELLEIFTSFAILVEDQGRMIDNIERNISTARDYVSKGTEQIEIAQTHQRKGRKCLWWIFLILFLVAVAIVCIAIFVPKKE